MNPFRTLQKAIQGGRSLIDALGLAAQVNEVEDWHEVGAVGEPAFENSWVNLGGPAATAAFYKDPFGMVHIKGEVTNPTALNIVFTLPVGYRPAKTEQFAVTSNNAFGELIVDGAGLLNANIGSIVNFSLQCRFRAV